LIHIDKPYQLGTVGLTVNKGEIMGKATATFKLTRFEQNPILGPDTGAEWESAYVTNPGAWYDGKKVWLLYRAGPDTPQHPIYFGLATSTDGFHFKREQTQPIFGPSTDGFDAGCVEDPRIIQFGSTYFVTYAARMFYPGRYWDKSTGLQDFNPAMPPEAPFAVRANITRSGIALTNDFKTWHRCGPITPANVDDRDVILFPERVDGSFVMLHRPSSWVGEEYGCQKPSIWLSVSDDLLNWETDHLLAQPHYAWESRKIGGSTPPIRTEAGWLTLYHGVDDRNVYRTGALLLDLKNPRRIIGRTPDPILEPEMDYELRGIMPNVVFPCGNVVIGDKLFVYYGGADRVCCVATAPLADLVELLVANPWQDNRP
jgi:predicted GH43/DUF377 family glycosyl hydrolase